MRYSAISAAFLTLPPHRSIVHYIALISLPTSQPPVSIFLSICSRAIFSLPHSPPSLHPPSATELVSPNTDRLSIIDRQAVTQSISQSIDQSINMSKAFTPADVASHNNPEKGLYIIVDTDVYDVTEFINEHPGGSKILKRVAGKDASKQFWKVSLLGSIILLISSGRRTGKREETTGLWLGNQESERIVSSLMLTFKSTIDSTTTRTC